MIKIEKLNKKTKVFDINVEKNHNFYANEILVHNCQEINLPTSPIYDINDGKIFIKRIKVNNSNLNRFLELKSDSSIKVNGKLSDAVSLIYHNSELQNIIEFADSSETSSDYTYFDQEFELMYGEKPAEIALCVLGAINLGAIKSLDELEEVCEYTVRMLDYVIEIQDYPVNAALKMRKRRSLGVGVTNFSYWLAKNNLNYSSKESLVEIDRLFEHIQFNLLKASNKLAKELGKCEYFSRTKYSKGLLPIDHYSKGVDSIVNRKLDCDWDSLRKDILEFGLRNSTLSAQMPCESSSLVSNSTNGIEPPRNLITVKKSKSGGPLPVVVPEISKLKNKYQFTWAFDNDSMNKVVAVIQKYFDQGISVNHYYDKKQYSDLNIPLSEVAKDLLTFYKFGGKQIYYSNSKDHKSDKLEDMITTEKIKEINTELVTDDVGCEGGSCSI